MVYLDIAGIIIAGILVISIALLLITILALRRTEEKRLRFVAGAFALFFVKGFVTALAIFTELIGIELLILLTSVLDLIILLLVFLPFLRS